MRLAVIGTGYVGLVVGAGFAETGNHVVCADVDAQKIAMLSAGRIPIFEPGLDELVTRNRTAGRLRFTINVGAAVEEADVVFIAVGTPPGEDGSADVQHVLAAARTIGEHMNGPKLVVTKSTVPVGTTYRVRDTIASVTAQPFDVASNPEFLKEGAAVEDFMKPDRVVIGVDSSAASTTLEDLYDPFMRTGKRLIVMDVLSAEVTKYAANAMLATRISFMNQLAELCEAVGADVSLVRRGVGSDPRIGPAFLFPGPGYGGSCFPKDVQALIRTAETSGVPADLFAVVDRINDRQRQRVFDKVKRALGGSVTGKTVALWGLAFKAETDDVRESPAVAVAERLLSEGATVRVYDPRAADTARQILGDRVTYAADAYEGLRGADALLIMTEWLEFRTPDFKRIRELLRQPLIVDGRNLYEPRRMRDFGFRYIGIGRGDVA